MSLSIENFEGCLIVRFTRPEMRNALSVEILKELHDLVGSLGSDVKKLIFTGSGESFASGANLTEIADINADTAREFALLGQTLMSKIADLSILTIAAVNGHCFGGGLDLALSCKQRIASPNAVFAHPGVGLGIITGWGGTQRLPRLIGEAAALEMLITADRFTAGWAARRGLVDTIDDDPLNYAVSHFN